MEDWENNVLVAFIVLLALGFVVIIVTAILLPDSDAEEPSDAEELSSCRSCKSWCFFWRKSMVQDPENPHEANLELQDAPRPQASGPA
jgi:hypothetical protein